MMKKRYIIILIIVFIVVQFSISAILYSYFSKRIDNSTRQAFIDESMSYLLTSEEFNDKYGLPISLSSEDEYPIENIDSEATEYYMNFTCVTENGSFDIRVYHTWEGTWTYSYEEVG